MGIIRGGVLGGFRNKTGAVIGSYWRRLDIIKGLPRISGKAPSQKQIDQRIKFKLVADLCTAFLDLIDLGYKNLSEVETPYNLAVSYHLKEAVTGNSPNFSIDFSKVMFSQGSLRLPSSFGINGTAPGEMELHWTNVGGDNRKQDGTDMLTVMVYSPTLDEYLTISNIAARSAQSYTLSLPAEFTGDQVHFYFSFNSVKKPGWVSKSKYMGLVTVL